MTGSYYTLESTSPRFSAPSQYNGNPPTGGHRGSQQYGAKAYCGTYLGSVLQDSNQGDFTQTHLVGGHHDGAHIGVGNINNAAPSVYNQYQQN